MKRATRLLLVLALFSLVFVTFFHEIASITQDLGRHLTTGSIILETHRVPTTNLFSYTHPTFPFINHHWLSEVVFALIFQRFGFGGLLTLTVILALVSFSLVFFFSLRKTQNLLAVSAVSVLYLGILSERTDVRPELFSFLFLSVFVVILYTYRVRFTRWIFLLPLLELLWINLHISFVVGTAVIALFLIDELSKNRKNVYCTHTSRLVLILFVSAFATLVNPNGIHGALYPFAVLQNYGYRVEENQNVFFLWQYAHKQTILYFAASSVLLFGSLLVAGRKARIIDWLLSIFFTTLAVLFIRNFPLFVFGTFPAFSYTLTPLFHRLPTHPHFRYGVSLALLLLLTWQIAHVFFLRNVGFGFPTSARDAASFFKANNLKGPIFNNFDIGSELVFHLYPKERVFIDGRPEAYPMSFFKNVYIPMQQDETAFEQFFGNYGINVVIFSHIDQTPWGSQFVRMITNHPSWALIYLDECCMVLVKNSDEHKKIIENLGMNKKNVHLSNFDHFKKESLVRLIGFFRKAGWEEQELAMYRKLVALEPHSCAVLFNLATRLPSSDPETLVYALRYEQLCR